MTEDIYAKLKRYEGLRLRVYTDSTGNPTIGYGHKLAPVSEAEYADGITEEQATYLLYADVALARHSVAQALPWSATLNQPRQDVLAMMAFQLGLGGLLGFRDMLACAEAGDFVGACRNMLLTGDEASKWFNQTPDRCAELARLMKDGQ